jgi:anthranilate phosphoribosyltransferase
VKQTLAKIQSGASLTEAEMISAMTAIMDGGAADSEIATFLTALAQRGETIDEITGAARVMRAKAQTIKAPAGALDCCGTGGDQSGTFNISTAVALVSAACGVPIAKHGNRAASSKSGTADVLEALGVPLEAPLNLLEHALEDIGFAFLMAPHHHPAVKHVREVRKALGIRTLFNLIGPLANPAGTKLQLIGVYSPHLLGPFAQVLKNLGSQRAWIVHGSDGLDEITLTGSTNVAILDEQGIRLTTLNPEDFGLPTCQPEDLKGGSASDNALALSELLKGQKTAYRDIVLANTAAALVIHGTSYDLKSGVTKAAAAIDSGKALAVLENYIQFLKDRL